MVVTVMHVDDDSIFYKKTVEEKLNKILSYKGVAG
jgi:hypothetical protein